MSRFAPLFIAVCALCPASFAETYVVSPDGSGDFPTIQAAIDFASDGDVIELTDGTFTGAGNKDLDYLGKAITIRSQSGSSEVCVIDCENDGRGVEFHSGEDAESALRSVTICNGSAHGGAVRCSGSSSRSFENCIFRDNESWSSGGALQCLQSSPTLVDCIFENNSAPDDQFGEGGAITCYGGALTGVSCSFIGNWTRCLMSCGRGGAILCNGTAVELQDCLFQENTAEG